MRRAGGALSSTSITAAATCSSVMTSSAIFLSVVVSTSMVVIFLLMLYVVSKLAFYNFFLTAFFHFLSVLIPTQRLQEAIVAQLRSSFVASRMTSTISLKSLSVSSKEI